MHDCMGLCMAQLFFCGMKRRKENLGLKKKALCS